MKKTREILDLTLKQRKFVKGYLEGKPMLAAAVEAGYSATTASRGATELLRSPKVRSTIQGAMEFSGITREKLAETLAGALEAMRPVVVGGKVQSWPDYAIRLKAADICLTLNGDKANPEGQQETYEDRLSRAREQIAERQRKALNP